jgi:spore coat protein CotH
MRKRAKALLLGALASIVGCSGYFIAQYNPAIDSGATELQQKVDRFLTELEQTSGEHEQYAATYEELRADIRTLREVASQQHGNELTLQSLDLIASNVDKLEAMHAEGISAEEIAIVRTLFDTQFRMLVQLETAKKRKEQ